MEPKHENISINEWEQRLDEIFALGKAQMETEVEPFFEAFAKVGDREVAIISACLLDNYLERLLKAHYLKDRKVEQIFKDEHVLQSFYSKISIGYFSGLIPKWLYHDLKLICEIRNKFAHRFVAVLRFNDEAISRRINALELRPRTLDNIEAPKLKFIIAVVQVAVILRQLTLWLGSVFRPRHLVDILGMNKWRYEEMALTSDEIQRIIAKTSN